MNQPEMMTTSARLARMLKLAQDGDESIYERVTLAQQVMADKRWVSETFLSDAEALEHLSNKYFNQLSGWITCGQLLAILDEFPDEQTWKAHRYNLRAMLDLLNDQREPATKTKEETAASSKGPSKEELRKENIDLKLLVANLRAEVAELKVELVRASLQPA